MKGTAKSKAVTSGRLTGGVAVRPARRRVSPNPGPAARPEPAYSLYSTDSEDQVTCLHKGLDRCAALLGGILQAEKAEASSGLRRAAKAGAAKPLPCASLGKKAIRKPRAQTGQRSCQVVQQRKPGAASPSATRQPAATAVPPTQPLRSPPPPSPGPPLAHLPSTTLAPQPRTSIPAHSLPELVEEEDEEVVPVRDVNARSAAACALKMAGLQLEAGLAAAAGVHEWTGAEAKTVRHLLGALKALIAGQGSVAERLVSQLEQTVSLPPMDMSSPDVQPEPDLLSLHSQNAQLRRRVRILQQQLKDREKAERPEDTETRKASNRRDSDGLRVPAAPPPPPPPPPEELAAARARLQELQGELAALRQALQDTRSRLRDREATRQIAVTDLAAARSRLLDSEREKSALASLAQQRLEEIGLLNRTLRSGEASGRSGGSGSGTRLATPQQHRRDPTEPPTERVAQYLMSLEATAREGRAPEQKDPAGNRPPPPPDQSRRSSSRWDVESVRSDSTFDTRDETAFRDGLAALDASIASLQKTIQLDLGK